MEAQQKYELLRSILARRLHEVPDIEVLIDKEPILKAHKYFLWKLVNEAEHQIDAQTEASVLTMQINGGLAFARLRNELVGTACAALNWQGEVRRLSMTQIDRLLSDPDPQLRRAAWQAQQAAFGTLEVPLSACLSAIKGEGIVLSQWKHYDSPLDWSLNISRINRSILEALKSAIWENAELFRRYLRAKAKALGHSGGLPGWDFRAPVGSNFRHIRFEEAINLLEDVLGAFDPRMSAMLKKAINNRWIDWSIRPNKGGDCFNSNLHAQGQSRIMVNFDGSIASVFTLAHELGHAYHDDCLRGDSILNTDYPMIIAETASIFNETLLFDALIKGVPSNKKLALLDMELYSVVRQTLNMMARLKFEEAIFSERSHRVLTPERINALMVEAQREAYGDAAESVNPYSWMVGDHLFLPEFHYYNYPYAFGRLFSRGLYAIYRTHQHGFADKYRSFLAHTGTLSVAEAAAMMGVDVYSRDFWCDAVRSFIEEIECFEALTNAHD